jgi:hypothetical protein
MNTGSIQDEYKINDEYNVSGRRQGGREDACGCRKKKLKEIAGKRKVFAADQDCFGHFLSSTHHHIIIIVIIIIIISIISSTSLIIIVIIVIIIIIIIIIDFLLQPSTNVSGLESTSVTQANVIQRRGQQLCPITSLYLQLGYISYI